MTTDALFLEGLLRRVLREELARERRSTVRTADRRLAGFLARVEAFCHAGAWTAAELLVDARDGRQYELMELLDAIVGDATDAPKALGRWLQRSADIEVDGRALVRVKREGNRWLYAVSGEL
jgi:hypothetical protein